MVSMPMHHQERFPANVPDSGVHSMRGSGSRSSKVKEKSAEATLPIVFHAVENPTNGNQGWSCTYTCWPRTTGRKVDVGGRPRVMAAIVAKLLPDRASDQSPHRRTRAWTGCGFDVFGPCRLGSGPAQHYSKTLLGALAIDVLPRGYETMFG